MIADIGYGALLLAFLSAGYAALAFVLGQRRRYPELIRSAENGFRMAALWVAASSLIMLYLLVSRDYQVRYVFEHVSNTLPLAYVLSAFWAGQEGSLLFWLLLVSMAGLVVLYSQRDAAAQPLRPYLLATIAIVQTFMALVLILPSNPFALLANRPADGLGLNPLLENVGMIFHPPTLFIGYALYTIPFAFVLAGILSGQPSDAWMARVRRWSLMAWLFLSIGIILGAWWAYIELGWGGYWAWDPVENSSLIPWLVGTAALHSAAVQSRRGIFRTWTAVLNILTFGLCIFATFVTRSGVIQSVHAFERSSLGWYFAAFLAIAMAGSLGLLAARRRAFADNYALESYLSREAGFLIGNLLLVGAAAVVFLGTIFPAITELFRGQQVALDAGFYNRSFGPIGLAIILLFGVCPVLLWRRTTLTQLARRLIVPAAVAVLTIVVLIVIGRREPIALVGFGSVAFVAGNILMEFGRGTLARMRSAGENPVTALLRVVGRDRRRYGGLIVHLGVLLIVLGVVGSGVYKQEYQTVMKPGETLDIAGYTVQYVQYVDQELPDKQRFATILRVSRPNGAARELVPEKNFHWNVEQWVSEVAVWSRPAEDFYIILAGLSSDGTATFQFLQEPLMLWMWIGGGVMVLGTLLAWWPAGERRRRSASDTAEG